MRVVCIPVTFRLPLDKAGFRAQVEQRCISLLRSDCSSRPLRAVKSVRATMDSMEPLLRMLPNFRVIHLIRDPRAVALSRIQFDASARGQFTNKVICCPVDQPVAVCYCSYVGFSLDWPEA